MSAKRSKRISDIYSYLSTHSYASVAELAKEFNVSISTIKRDIADMERTNMTERIKKGSIINLTHEDPAYSVRKNINSDSKKRIATAAAELVEDDDVILILGGITCFELYKSIHAKNVTVFTLNPESLLHENPSISHLYVLEGEVSPRYGVITGSLTMASLAKITPKKVFFSCSINDNFIIQCRTDSELTLLNAIADMPSDVCKVFMTDHSKLRVRQTFSAFSVNQTDVFVSDIDLEPAIRQEFEANHLRIINVNE